MSSRAGSVRTDVPPSLIEAQVHEVIAGGIEDLITDLEGKVGNGPREAVIIGYFRGERLRHKRLAANALRRGGGAKELLRLASEAELEGVNP